MRFLRETAALVVLAGLPAGCGGGSGGGLPVIEPAAVTPPPGTVVDAQEWGTRDVALARAPGRATVSVVDALGHGIDGLTVRVDGRAATPCSNGCYRAPAGAGPVTVRIGIRSFRFTIPASAPSGLPLLHAAMRGYAQLRTVALHQELSSGRVTLVTNFRFIAPNRLRYAIRGGSQAIVIGAARWDRPSAADPWVQTGQSPVTVMNLPWQRATNVRLVAPRTVTFFDQSTRAWFRVVLSGTNLPLTERMTGVSHFMRNTYSAFDAPAQITAPTG